MFYRTPRLVFQSILRWWWGAGAGDGGGYMKIVTFHFPSCHPNTVYCSSPLWPRVNGSEVQDTESSLSCHGSEQRVKRRPHRVGREDRIEPQSRLEDWALPKDPQGFLLPCCLGNRNRHTMMANSRVGSVFANPLSRCYYQKLLLKICLEAWHLEDFPRLLGRHMLKSLLKQTIAK